MDQLGTKKGEVTIRYWGPQNVTIEPSTGLVDRIVQKMTWKFVDETRQGRQLAVPGGIYFPWPLDPAPEPPPVYSEWPGDIPTGTGTEYTAKVNKKAPGPDPIYYLYYIKIDTGEIITKAKKTVETYELIDPPIENQPVP
ncbi:MAG TPA: hypothetical protein VF846_07410 [Thermoanaerobaculia bacterium]